MPNRIIKESICTSDNIDQLSAFQETVFYRMIVNCDDYGRMDARPKILASKLFPLKDIRTQQIEEALRALTSAELVILYEVDGKPFLQMKTWDRHQQVRAKRSKYPAPESGIQKHDINCYQMQADASKCPRNPIQSESNPKEEKEENAHTREEMPFGLTDEDIHSSLSENREIEDAAKSAGLNVSEMNMVKAREYARVYGMDKLLDAIAKTAHGAERITWAYVEGVLKNNGTRPEAQYRGNHSGVPSNGGTSGKYAHLFDGTAV